MVFQRRVDAEAVDGRPGASFPVDRLLRAGLVEELELLLEQDLVVGQVEAEQREGLNEGAAAQHDLGPAVGDGVHGGEALEDPDRVIGAEDGDGGAEPDVLGAGGRCGEEYLRGGDCEVAAVVLPHREGVQADLVRELGLFQQLPQHLGVRDGVPVREDADVAEGVQSQQDAARAHGGGRVRPGCRVTGLSVAVFIRTPSASRRARSPSRSGPCWRRPA